MPKEWKTPGGSATAVCLDMLKQPHLLIAGSTGSGKSVLLNSLIYTALFQAPHHCNFILIDPKRVELSQYKRLPHTLIYCNEPPDIITALNQAINLMEIRFTYMERHNLKEWDGDHTYIFIDEFADLMTTSKRETLPALLRLTQLGRAARIHLIIATQRPTRDIVNGQIKVNLDSRIALRCPTAQDSRNIINTKGAETLPRFGFGYYLTPDTMQPLKIIVPNTPPEELAARVEWWEAQNRHKSIFERIAARR